MPTTENFSEKAFLQAQSKDSSYDFEMALLLISNGNFRKSLPHIQKAMSLALEKKDFRNYFSCYLMGVQASNELMETDLAKEMYEEVQNTCKTYSVSLTPMALACAAYYSIYIDKDWEKAKQQLNSALKTAFDTHEQAVKSGDQLGQNSTRYDIIFCLYNYSLYYFTIGDYESCIQELKNLKILLDDYLKLKEEVELENTRTEDVQKLQTYRAVLEDLKKSFPNLQKIQLGLNYMSAWLEMLHAKDYKKADKILWELYEKANKTYNMFFIPYILYSMSWCHTYMKNDKQALMFFNLAKKNASKERKILLHFIDDLEQKAKWNQSTENEESYDLIFDIKDHLIVEKQKGCIELKNQFILMDLLKLFSMNPGVSYSKEQIIQKIWKQEYLPETHDNKIYVTIKRLREMIEIDPCKPYYIRRNNAGYHFSKQAKVLVKQ